MRQPYHQIYYTNKPPLVSQPHKTNNINDDHFGFE